MNGTDNLDEFYKKWALPMTLMQMAKGVLTPAPVGGSPFAQIAGGISGGANSYMQMMNQRLQEQRLNQYMQIQKKQEERQEKQWALKEKQWAEPTKERTFTGFGEGKPSVSTPALTGLGAGTLPLQYQDYGVETTTTPGGSAWEGQQADIAYKKAQTAKAMRPEKADTVVPDAVLKANNLDPETYHGITYNDLKAGGIDLQPPAKEPSYSKIEAEIFVKWLDDKPLSKKEQQIINNKLAKEGRETPAEVYAKAKARWMAQIETAEEVLKRKLADDEKRAIFINDLYGLLGPAGLGGLNPNPIKYDSTGKRIQ